MSQWSLPEGLVPYPYPQKRPVQAQLAVAGIDSTRLAAMSRLVPPSRFGVAGVNCRSLFERSKAGAKLAAAVNPTSTIRKTLGREITLYGKSDPVLQADTEAYLGDRIRAFGLEGMVYLLDWQYLVCSLEGKQARPGRKAVPGPAGWTMTWRDGFETMFGEPYRVMDLYLDAGSFRKFTGSAEIYYGLDTYYKAIRLIRPKGWMHMDEVHDNQKSYASYLQMVVDGFGEGWNGEGCIPVWQARIEWDFSLDCRIVGPGSFNERQRNAIANARRHARDPILRFYASRHNLVAIGELAAELPGAPPGQKKIPREVRGLYLVELQRCLSAAAGHKVMLWALGQASELVINQIREREGISKIWSDGTWWVHNARNQRLPYIMNDGYIRSHDYGEKWFDPKVGKVRFKCKLPFTLGEMMVANLRTLQGAYLGLYEWPKPLPLPIDVRDMEQLAEIKQLMGPLQLNLMPQLEVSA